MDYEKLIAFHNRENPFTKEMGVHVIEIREGYAKLKLDVEKGHTNALGIVHGGCLFTVADSACGVAASSYEKKSVTVNACINYLSPALRVKELIGEATVIKHGKRISVFQAEVKDESGNLLVRGEFTYYDLGKNVKKINDNIK